MTDLEEVKSLLAKAGAIGVKYSGIAEREQYGFNAFSILRKTHEEVGLHSAFLKSLFDPQGGHGQGVWFLNTFLEKAGIQPFDEQENIQVFSEYTRLRDGSQGGNRERDSIDIYIKTGDRAVIIENKIYAGNREKQLCRYVRLAMDENFAFEKIDVIYLSLDGREPGCEPEEFKDINYVPSKDDGCPRLRFGDAEKEIKLMSYATDIIDWLDKCIEHMAKHPTTRETLVLYQRIVQELTGQAMNEEENMEIADVLMETPKSFAITNKIVSAFDKAKAKTQLQFWEGLQSELTSLGLKESAIMDESEKGQKYTSEKVSACYTQRRNRPWYGIKVLLGTMKQHPEIQICFYIEVEWNIYYGFIVQTMGGIRISDAETIGKIQELLNAAHYKVGDGWPAWRYPKDDRGAYDLNINFKKFEGESLELIDKDHRKSYLEQLAQEVKKAIQEGVNIMKSNELLINEKDIWINPTT